MVIEALIMRAMYLAVAAIAALLSELSCVDDSAGDLTARRERDRVVESDCTAAREAPEHAIEECAVPYTSSGRYTETLADKDIDWLEDGAAA